MAMALRYSAVLVFLLASAPAHCVESPTPRNLYFDPDALGVSPAAFNPAVSVPPIVRHFPSRPLDISKSIEPLQRLPQQESVSTTKEDDDSFGRIPLRHGSFGIETERKFNADKAIPSSQYFDQLNDRYSKKPFIGLSIEAPYASEGR